jgi:hypothetical protein
MRFCSTRVRLSCGKVAGTVHKREPESQALNLPVRSGQDVTMPDNAGSNVSDAGGVESACHASFPSFHALLLRELEALFAGAVVSPAIAARYLIAAARAVACTTPPGLAVAHRAAVLPTGPLACLAEVSVPPPGALDACLMALTPVLEQVPASRGVNALEGAETLHPWACAVWDLLPSTARILASGGDERLDGQAGNGLNRYGVGSLPRPEVLAFASSTASDPSARGFASARAARLALVRALAHDWPDKEAMAATVSAATLEVKAFLADFFGADSPDHIILAASGTDCAMAATAMCALRGSPVTIVLPGAEETGSGVPQAACGRHFAIRSAHGMTVEKDAVVEGFSAQTACVPVAVREADGTPRQSRDVLADCTAQIEQAIRLGRRVLLYVLDVSKTGLVMPDAAGVEALCQRFPGQIDVLVDGCQARFLPEEAGAFLRRGWAVMVTGSKFYAGPPFCGALLLPQHWRQRLSGENEGARVAEAVTARADDMAEGLPAALPTGLGDYAWRSEWPAAPVAACLPEGFNAGLFLRWRGACAEMAAFTATPVQERQHRLDLFLSGVAEVLTACPMVRLLASAPREHWTWEESILTFLVLAPSAREADHVRPAVLDMDRSRRLHRWLQADLSAYVPDGPGAIALRALVAVPCHVGQPVALPCEQAQGGIAGALRIAASARHVTAEEADAATETAVHIRAVGQVLRKLVFVLDHWESIAARDPVPCAASVFPLLRLSGGGRTTGP